MRKEILSGLFVGVLGVVGCSSRSFEGYYPDGRVKFGEGRSYGVDVFRFYKQEIPRQMSVTNMGVEEVFACKGFADYDGNGVIELDKREVIWPGVEFYDSQNVIFGLRGEGVDGEVRFGFGGEERVVEKDPRGNFYSVELGRLGVGEHEGFWRFGGEERKVLARVRNPWEGHPKYNKKD